MQDHTPADGPDFDPSPLATPDKEPGPMSQAPSHPTPAGSSPDSLEPVAGMGPGDPWIATRSGVRVSLLCPKPETLWIKDIAQALSNICRYNGHTSAFYSVAEHSVLVSKLCPPEHALWGLLHDAPEAYLGDVTRPLKRLLDPVYSFLEDRFMEAVHARFLAPLGLPKERPPEVTAADNLAYWIEVHRLSLLAHGPLPESAFELAEKRRLGLLSPRQARDRFLERYRELTEGVRS